jgi:hypothetical protein
MLVDSKNGGGESDTNVALTKQELTKEKRCIVTDRLCGLMVRVLGYRSPEARVQFPALPEKKVVSMERGPLSLVSTTEELLERKVAAPV